MTKTNARALYLDLLQDAYQRGRLLESLPPRARPHDTPPALISAVFPRLFASPAVISA